MNKLFSGICFLLIANLNFAQTYTPSDVGSSVGFVIKNFGIKTNGDLKGLKGSILYNPTAILSTSFNVSVDANTINTNNNGRDKHLRKADYFDVQKFPIINLTSTKVTASTVAGTYILFGNLTIKGVTKSVQFPFTVTTKPNGYLFAGSFEINRRDFGVGGSSISMADKLTVTLSVLATK